jgi:hypothetical protein
MEGFYLIVGFTLGILFSMKISETMMGLFFKLTFAETVDIFNNWYSKIKLRENRNQKELTISERNAILKDDIIFFMQRTVSKNLIEDNIFDDTDI